MREAWNDFGRRTLAGLVIGAVLIGLGAAFGAEVAALVHDCAAGMPC